MKANNFDRTRIKYQFSTYGNQLDFIIKDGDNSMVIDTKYKLHYKQGHIHSDIRQVSGYARLRKVRNELLTEAEKDKIIACLIVYPEIGIERDFNYTLECWVKYASVLKTK